MGEFMSGATGRVFGRAFPMFTGERLGCCVRQGRLRSVGGYRAHGCFWVSTLYLEIKIDVCSARADEI